MSRRDYARIELKRRLAPHCVDNDGTPSSGALDELEKLLDQLSASGLLSDERFAEARARARGARLGNARLRLELSQKGVEDALIDNALANLPDEFERAYAVWEKKYKQRPSDRAEWAKQARFLLSRGFSVGTIKRVLDRNEAPDCLAD